MCVRQTQATPLLIRYPMAVLAKAASRFALPCTLHAFSEAIALRR